MINPEGRRQLRLHGQYDLSDVLARLHQPVGGNRGLRSAALEKAAKEHGATIYQLAIAWLLQRSPVMLPIPGTSSVAHLEENVAAAKFKLSADEWQALTA